MNPISINGSTLATQPSSVNENPIQIRTANQAIDGTQQVNSMGLKNNAVLGFTYVSASFFQTIKALGDAVTPVTYQNTNSNVVSGTLSFTGFLTYQEDVYLPGASAMVPLVVTIRQV